VWVLVQRTCLFNSELVSVFSLDHVCRRVAVANDVAVLHQNRAKVKIILLFIRPLAVLVHQRHVNGEPEFIAHHSARVALANQLRSGHVIGVETVATISTAVVGVLLLLASGGGAFGSQGTKHWPSTSRDRVGRFVLGVVADVIVIIVVCNVIDVKCLSTIIG